MRPHQIFASMTAGEAEAFFKKLGEEEPGMLAQAAAASAAALKSRPAYVLKLPFEKQAATIRRALARVASDAFAEELLAIYFLRCRLPLLTEWLDAVGLEHEEGGLTNDAPPEPSEAALRSAVESFRAAAAEPATPADSSDGCDGSDRSDRELLLRAFAAQSAIQWPLLDALVDPS